MNWILRRLRALFRRDSIEQELGEEVRQHIALEAEDIARTQGVTLEEARRRALVSFGGVSRFEEAHRDARGVRWIEDSMADVRYALRSLRRSPGFTLSAVTVLALGIGATTAAFSAVDAVLLDPSDRDLSVVLLGDYPSLSAVDIRAIEEHQRSFSAVGAIRRREAGFTAGGEPERVRVGSVTAGFFRALQVRPLHGRGIEAGDEAVGAPRVAVLSHAFAGRALGGAAAIGRSVIIDGAAHIVVGVLPSDVKELAGYRAEVWTGLQLATPERRGPFGLLMVGRLLPNVSFEAATRDLRGVGDRVHRLWSTGPVDRNYSAVPIRTAALGDGGKLLRIFAAAVGLVLLIAVANVASLMLVRAIGRAREVSVRAMLGATRARLVRLIVTESLVLSSIGALAGIAVGALGLRALIALGLRMPRLSSAELDLRAIGFAVGVALLTGLIVGAYPVAQLLSKDGARPAQGGDRTIGAGRRTQAARSVFVITQFALALPLLAVAGLLLNSFSRLQRVNPGFDPQNLLTVRVSLPTGVYADSVIGAYYDKALPRLREIPGVRAVGVGSAMPPNLGGAADDNFNLIDRPVAPGVGEPNAPWPSVSADYFTALGVRLLDGRGFSPIDTAGAGPVVLVSRSWVRQFYPDVSPIGRTMIRGGCTECPPTTVIGVVDDVRYSGLEGAAPAIYSPVTELWRRDSYLFIRTAGAPAELLQPVRTVLRSIDPEIPLGDAASMEERLYASLAQPRHWARLLVGFAAAALALAAIGIFGMLAYSVSTRHREIGVRMALGAQQREVVWTMVGRGLVLAASGTAIGLIAALIATRSMASLLFEVNAYDPATLAAVTFLLLTVALVASYLPARRAAGINPVEAIRAD